MKKRILSFLIVLLLLVTILPIDISASAATVDNNGVTGNRIVEEARSWHTRTENGKSIYQATYFSEGGTSEYVARRTGYNASVGRNDLSFDCSGFVSRVLNDVGIRVTGSGNNEGTFNKVLYDTYGPNHVSSDAQNYICYYGEDVSNALQKAKNGDLNDLKPGDLLGWKGGSVQFPNSDNHIAIYAGNGEIVHFTGNGFRDETMSASYLASFKYARRLVPNGSTYLSQCTYSSSSDIVEITSDNAWFKALPCSNETAKKYGYTSVSVIESALPVGTTFRTSGLYKNSEGNYWYSATIIKGPNEGKSGYIYKGDTKVVYAPQSYLDDDTRGGAGTIHVRGWSFDRDGLSSSVPIHVYVGGPADSGASCFIINANKYRPDVNEAFPGVGDYHGFEETLNVKERGTQTLYFYAVDLNGGPGNQFIGTATVIISEPSTSDNSIQLDVPLLPQSTGYTCADASARECIAYYYNHGIVTGKSATVPSESQLVSEYGSGSITPIVNGLRDYCGVSFGYREKTTPEDFYAYISNSLKKGNPVVANVYLNTDTSWVLGYTTNGHYIVISGIKKINGEEHLTITDPWNKNGAGIGQVIDVPWIHICNICVYYVCEQNGLEVIQLPTGSAMTVGAGRTIPDGDYIIATAADPNYFLDIVGEDLPAANGANVSLYGPRNGEVPAYDVWTVKYIDDGGFYSICQKGTNMSLDVDGASITAGGNIQAYTHHGSSCQQWSIFSNDDGSYRIRAKCSGFSLDYYDGVLAAGTNVVQWFDTAYDNQKWTFIPCTCTVTYDANGGTGAPESQTAEIGSTIILSSDIPSRASITEDYTVTLNANGGSVSQSSMSATHTTSYSFMNWNTKAGGIGISYNPGASYPANESATLYAQWNYTINYNSIILPVPTRTGYVFKGWGTSSDAISGVTGSYSPSGNETLYAIWEEVNYTVSYDANGGIGAPEAQMVRAGTVAILSTVEPTREGYVFLGWTSNSIATAPQYLAGSSFMPEKDTTLFAVWEKGTLSEWTEIKPTGVDESLIETKIQYRYRDKETTTSTESSVDGWILEGSQQGWSDYGPWSEWQDSAISSSDSTKVESRTVYPYYYFYCTNCGTGARYPYWGSDQACEICHNTGTRPNNGVVEWFPNPWSDSIAWGNNTGKYYQYIDGGIWWNWTNGEPKTQYRSSTRSIINTYYFYRWTGWSTWSDNSVAESDTREVETRTLYRYVIKEYTIAYDANGGTNAPNSQAKIHDTTLTLTASTPSRANASAGSYTVTLDANGGSVSTTSLSAACTTSYTFKNWNTAANGSGTSYAPGASYTANAAATLYAQWNSSTSTAAVTLPTPTRSGYSFLGWGTSSSAASSVTGSYTPTGNVTLYAVWKSPDFTLPAALTNIGDEAFTGSAFTYAKLPENAVSIGWHAFADCPNLAYIYIPAQTTQIDAQAFGNMQGLTILGKTGSTAETYAQNHNYTFIAVP